MSKNNLHTKTGSIQDNEWLLSRRKFIKTLVLSGIAIQLPWLSSCSEENEFIENTSPLTINQYKTVRAVQDILFPDDGNGPGARQINAGPYLVWVLNDQHLDPDENNYIIERIDELESYSKENYGNFFHNLSLGNQEEIIEQIINESWGSRFMSRLITLIFEALLLDPAYGSNPKGIGWEWLEHDPGQPRPTKKILYPEILNNI